MDLTNLLSGGGGALQRQSSFERMMASLSSQKHVAKADLESSSELIQSWWRRKLRMKKLQLKMNTDELNSALILTRDTLKALPPSCASPASVASSNTGPSLGLDSAQSALSSPFFKDALNSLLCALPRDPVLKTRNNQARSAPFVATALVVGAFPDDLLVVTDITGSEQPDRCYEARMCRNAASLLSLSLQKLLSSVSSSSGVSAFRAALLMYRFSVRYFIRSMDIWKKLDTDRMAASLEEPFRKCYSTAQAMAIRMEIGAGPGTPQENAANAGVLDAQLSRMRMTFEKLLGPTAARTKIEELESQATQLIADTAGASGNDSDSLSATGGSSVDLGASLGFNSTTDSLPLPNPPSSPLKDRMNEENEFFEAEAVAAANASTTQTQPPHAPTAASEIVSPAEEQYLERLSKVAGMENERLAHELSVDSSFTLPKAPADLTLPSQESVAGAPATRLPPISDVRAEQERIARLVLYNPSEATAQLKKRVLIMLGDALYWSLKGSDLKAEGLGEQLYPGRVIPVTCEGRTLTARVDGVVYVESSCTLTYLVDGVQEKGVSFSRLKTDTTPADPGLLVQALTDIANQVASLTPTRVDIKERLLGSIDAGLISQMVTHNALGAKDLLSEGPISVFIEALGGLLEPSRAALCGQWRDSLYARSTEGTFDEMVVPLLPHLFEVCTSLVEEVKREMACYYVEMLAPAMAQNGAKFLKKKFQTRLEDQMNNLVGQVMTQRGPDFDPRTLSPDVILINLLPRTAGLLLPGTHPKHSIAEGSSLKALPLPCNETDLREAGYDDETVSALLYPSDGPPIPSSIDAAAVCLFIRTVQIPCRLDSPQATQLLPELFGFDAGRLAKIRDDADVIALQATIIITIKLLINRFFGNTLLISHSDMETLQQRMDVIFRSTDSGLANVITEAVRFVRVAATRAQSQPAGWEASLDTALRDAVKEGSPVLTLFSKRVYKLFLRGLAGKSYQQLLQGYSLGNTYSREAIRDLITSTSKLLSHFLEVHRETLTLFYNGPREAPEENLAEVEAAAAGAGAA